MNTRCTVLVFSPVIYSDRALNSSGKVRVSSEMLTSQLMWSFYVLF